MNKPRLSPGDGIKVEGFLLCLPSDYRPIVEIDEHDKLFFHCACGRHYIEEDEDGCYIEAPTCQI